MNKRLKIFSIILSVALVLPMQPLSANKQSNNDNRTKDLIEFKQTNTSEKKDDLNLYEKSIENNNFNVNSKTLKQDPYKIHTDYSSIDNKVGKTIFPRTFFFRSINVADNPKYDLRDIGKVTSVKDQGPNGSCWAFATFGSAESILMPDERMDFSEKHMRNTHGFDWGPSDGGTRTVSSAYLARRSGPVLEKDDPYDIYGSDSPENLPIAKELTQAIFLPDRRDSNDNNLIKSMITKYGGVYSAVMGGDEYLNKKTMAHYYSGAQVPNHAITIVGWDDNYSKKNFKTTPQGDGAWICKNSWGTGWGTQGGYYYVSYYDKNIGTQNSQYILKDLNENEKIWQYDKLGMTSQVGLGEESYYANVFGPVKEDTYLSSVGLWTSANNAEYEVFVNTNVDKNGGLSQKNSVKQGKMQFAGYEKVKVDDTLISKGSKFAVIVRMKTPGYKYPIPIERPIKGFSSKTTAETGQSFVSKDGEKWTDLTDQIKNANVSLKAFTIDGEHINGNNENENKIESIKFKEKEKLLKIGEAVTLGVDLLPKTAITEDLKWESSDKTVCDIDNTGKVKAVGYGECIITAKSKHSYRVFDTMRIRVDESNAQFKANISSDKQSYIQGEQVGINIALKDQNENQIVNKGIECEIVTSHDQNFKYNLKTNLTGEANFNVKLANTAAIGKYKVNVYYKNKLIGINTFNVESKDFVPTVENPLFVENKLDKDKIKPNTQVKLVSTVTNKYAEIKRYAKVNATITSPSQKEYTKSLYTDKQGQAIFDLEKEMFNEEGVYKIKVNASLSGFDDFTETLDLHVDRNTTEMKNLDLQMNLSKKTFMVKTEPVNVDFVVNNENKPISDANIRLTITDPNQKSYDVNLKTDKDGKSNFSMNLSERNVMGTYKIEAVAYKEGYYDVEKSDSFFAKKDGKYLNISFESAKKVYKLNESAYIKIQIKDENNNPMRNSSVDITILDPNQQETKIRKVSDYQGYVFIYMTPKAYTSKGEYSIKAVADYYNYPSSSANYRIKFGEDEDYKGISVNAKNRKEQYFVDEVAEIDFKTVDEYGNSVNNAEVNISVKTPDGKVIIDRTTTDDKSIGSWIYKLKLAAGKYDVTLKAQKSNYKSLSQTISFTVVERPKLKKFSTTIMSDKKIYEATKNAVIKLNLKDEKGNNFSNVDVKVREISPNSKKESNVKTDEQGNIELNVNTETQGKYELYFDLSKENYEKTTKRFVFYSITNQIPKTNDSFFDAKNATDVTKYLKTQKPFILDVRSKASFERSHIDNSFNMDLNDTDFDDFMNALDKTTNLFVISNLESESKIKQLKDKGFKSVAYIKEGMQKYIEVSGLENKDYNKNLRLDIIRDKSVYNSKNEITFDVKTTDSNYNYIAKSNVKYKLLDLAGTEINSGELQTNNIGQEKLKIKLSDNIYPGTYKIIAEANKDGYYKDCSFTKFDISNKDVNDDFINYDDANKSSYFAHLKDDKESKDLLKNIYGKNLLGYSVNDLNDKSKLLNDVVDLKKPSIVLFDNNKAKLEDFANKSHETYNFVRITSENDKKNLQEKNLRRLISTSFIDTDNDIRNSKLSLTQGIKILVLDEEGRVVNLINQKDFNNIKTILAKQNIKIEDKIVDPNVELKTNQKANINITSPNTTVKRKDVVQINVELKNEDTKEYLANRNIKYTLQDPFGRTVSYNRQTDKNGRHILKIGTNDKTTLGKYSVKVELLDAEYQNAFKFIEYQVVSQNTPDLLQMKALIKTDKEKYELGDSINLELVVSDLNDSKLDKAQGQVILEDSNQKQLFNKSAVSDNSGKINLSFITNDSNVLGQYTLKIKISREGFKDYNKEISIQIGDKPSKPDEKPDEKPDKKPDKKPDEKPENPIDVEIKEQNFPLSFEQAYALGFFDATDNLTMINVKSKYGFNYSNFVLYDKNNKPIKIQDLIDNKRPTIFLMGDRVDSQSLKMFENSSNINDKAFNFVNVITNGNQKDLEQIGKGKLYSDLFMRGNSLNGQFRSNKNQVVILDKNGSLLNVFPYKSNYELLRRFNMSNGYYADNKNFKQLSLDKFKSSYPISLEQRKNRKDYEKLSENEAKFSSQYAKDLSRIKLIDKDNKPKSLDEISKKDIKILLIGDYRKEDTIKMWENSKYIKEGNYDLINVSYLGAQADINKKKERFESLENVKKEIYVTGAYNSLIQVPKPTIVAIDKNQNYMFTKEYNSNEDIKYVLDRTVNTFASNETITDSFKPIEDLKILEELPKEKDPNRIVPMTYSQRKERGDYRIFEPNEKEVNEKYYGRDMNMYLMKDINSNQKYIKEFLNKKVNVMLVGSPEDKNSRIMWKNSSYLNLEKINLIKISNYKDENVLKNMFNSYDMNDVKTNFYCGGEKFDFDKSVSSPYVLITDENGRMLFVKKYISNQDIEDLVNRSLQTKYTENSVGDDMLPIQNEKISLDNKNHEPKIIENVQGVDPDENVALTFMQRESRGDYKELNDNEKKFNKLYYGRDIKNYRFLKNDKTSEKISELQDENLTILLLGNYKENSSLKMWQEVSRIQSDEFSIKNMNTIGNINVINDTISSKKLDISEIYTNANSIFYLNNRRNNTIVAIDKNSKVIFIKDYNDMNDIKYVLDRTLKTQFSKDVLNIKVPEVLDVDLSDK
ncbi:MAG: lectin like domain-containing protein [Finegoldia magna]|uniref:lectin like domain-containing protein n=1 Tax=Finegoldia magna TaxID=1260 RepID=UPI0026ECDFB7|nr:lectin like domain-containing protein [Finegoldia magna]MBS5775927.1 Ig-like domain-containing protein [Finegoldia magna]MDU2574686.1 lectin like domain-containing protein [Finegoldia magna]MDU7479256.1 lectin like domain-containing protein [Finegoldia magna]